MTSAELMEVYGANPLFSGYNVLSSNLNVVLQRNYTLLGVRFF